MKEFTLALADNGFILSGEDCLSVYEQRHRDDVPQKMLENILSELVSGITNLEDTSFKVKVEVKPLKNTLCETEQ